jgi:hypothetical protein
MFCRRVEPERGSELLKTIFIIRSMRRAVQGGLRIVKPVLWNEENEARGTRQIAQESSGFDFRRGISLRHRRGRPAQN